MGKKSNYQSFIGGNRLGSSPDKRRLYDVKANESQRTMQDINDVLMDEAEENFDIDDDTPPSMISVNKT